MTHEELISHLHYEPETGVFTWKKTASGRTLNGRAGSDIKLGGKEYRTLKVLKEAWLEHRLAFFYVTGAPPESEIDHIDGDGRNNRIANLREVSRGENLRNQHRYKNNKSGVNGVFWDKAAKRWRVCIGINGKTRNCGNFKSIEDAKHYRSQLEVIHGYHQNHGLTDAQRKVNIIEQRFLGMMP